jgi:hypothetical protein
LVGVFAYLGNSRQREQHDGTIRSKGVPAMEEASTLADERRVGRVADDLLIGAHQIARELGVNVRAVYLLRQTKRLPIRKLGKNLVASRGQLRRAARALTA